MPTRSCIDTGPSSSGVKSSPVADRTSGGPEMPSVESSVAITTSEVPAMLAWPAKLGPDRIVTIGTRPESRASWMNVVTVPLS